MKWAELVLEYLQALAWPGVVGGALWVFRKQIAAKIGDLKDATTPVGGATFFDRDARAVEELADRAADRQEATAEAKASEAANESSASPKPEATPDVPQDQSEDDDADHMSAGAQAWLRREARFRALSSAWIAFATPPDFSTAKEVSTTSPEAAVLLAFADLEKLVRAAWTVDQMEASRPISIGRAIEKLTRGPLPDFAEVGRDLVTLRNRVAHGDTTVTTAGALDFIRASERLAEALTAVAISKMRHPSRSQVISQWVKWMEDQAEGETDSPLDES